MTDTKNITNKSIKINPETLTLVLSKMFSISIICADYQTVELTGGYVGDVRLITGTAEADDGERLPYKVVLKVQQKWERPGDPNSWRREYELYVSDFGTVFTDSLRWAECYHAEINREETETQLWIEYIDGISGKNLTMEMREKAAEELGHFQGRIYKKYMPLLKNVSCLTQIEDVQAKDYFTTNRPRIIEDEYSYIRHEDCKIPKHLCKMIIDVDNETEKLYLNVDNMPVVLCHRDFWFGNIIYSDGKIILLDWDCTGWGYMFEDIIKLIYANTGFNNIDESYRKFIPAYLKGISGYIDISKIDDLYAWKILILYAAYAPVHLYRHTESSNLKNLAIDTLQKIFEMRDKK